jgi:hypothetical protein
MSRRTRKVLAINLAIWAVLIGVAAVILLAPDVAMVMLGVLMWGAVVVFLGFIINFVAHEITDDHDGDEYL